MTIEEKKIRHIIKQELKNRAGNISETDLVASDKSSWENMKSEFKKNVAELLKNIEKDDYNDATGEISKTISMLQRWKSKIDKGLMDETNQS